MSIQGKPKRYENGINKNQVKKFVDVSALQSKVGCAKKSISLRFDVDLLSDIDNMAKRRGMSRNSIISYWCSKGIENE